MRINGAYARQILDSRGNPTIEVSILLENGVTGVASAPSGASTGRHEAVERRDGIPSSYRGKSVMEAVQGVNDEIRRMLRGCDVFEQRRNDRKLLQLDGTPDKSRLGANALVATSLACARAAAQATGLPLFRYLGGVDPSYTPCPMMNVLNGGAHADNNLDIQEFMIVPIGAKHARDAVRMGADIYHELGDCLRARGQSTAVGDEGGYAPPFANEEDALEILLEAVERAGYVAGEEVAFALDVAASGWQTEAGYQMPKRGEVRSRAAHGDWLSSLCERYPILSVEDGFGEEDFEGFRAWNERMGERVMVVGDDLYTTNPARIARGILEHSGNAVLIKPNQIGTLTETLDAIAEARRAGWRVVVSHRSGDTADAFIVDLAVAVGAEYLKAGAPCRSERVEKYNRLMAIGDMISV